MLLPVVAALIPLAIAPGFLFFYDVTPKYVLLLIGVAAALPWIALPRSREARWLWGLLTAQAVSLVVSTALSTRVEASVFGGNWRRYGLVTQLAILLFTAIAAAGPRERVRLYLRAIAIGAIPVALYGVAQYFGWDPWIPKHGYHIGEGVWTIVRPPSTLGYVSYFAGYLAITLFLACALFVTERSARWRTLAASAAALSGFAILLSGARAAIAGAALGAIFLWLWRGGRIGVRPIAAVAAGVAALALFVASPAGQMVRSRYRWFVEDPHGGARPLLFRDSLRLAARRPLAGAGPETFAAEFPRVQSPELSRAYPAFYHESAHNILLDALTAQGVPGLLILAGLIGLGFAAARRVRRKEPALSGALAAALFSGLIAHQFSVFTIPTALYFFLTIALLTALTPEGVYVPSRRYLMLAPAALLLVPAVRVLVADYKLNRVRALLAAGESRAAAIEYSQVRRWGLTADIWYSGQQALLAFKTPDMTEALTRWQQALEAGHRATTTADDPHNAWYNLAVLYSRQNDFRNTERALRQAIAASPNWFKPHWMLARTLELRNRDDEALAEAELAIELNGGKDPEVARTLAAIIAKK